MAKKKQTAEGELSGADIKSEIPESAKTVTVACKLPHGLLIQCHKMVPHQEQIMGGGMRDTFRAESVGDPIKINGCAVPHGHALGDVGIVSAGGFALTSDVDADYFRQWMKEQEHSSFVKEGLIFALPEERAVIDMAKEHKNLKSGFERIDPDNPPRVSRQHKVVKADKAETGAEAH